LQADHTAGRSARAGASRHMAEDPAREFDCSGNAGIIPTARAGVGCTWVAEGKTSTGSSGAGSGNGPTAALLQEVGRARVVEQQQDGARSTRPWFRGAQRDKVQGQICPLI